RSGSVSHGYSLLLEDMRLAFPDKPMSVHLSRLDERAVWCPLLAWEKDTSRWRFLITSGQGGIDKTLLATNQDYLRNHQHGTVLYKPVGGLVDLWDKLGLPRDAVNFSWPPSLDVLGKEGLGHGTPGKLMLIADRLLQSARSL